MEAKAVTITVRLLPDLLAACDRKAAEEFMSREQFLRHLVAKATGAKDSREAAAPGLFGRGGPRPKETTPAKRAAKTRGRKAVKRKKPKR